MSNNGVVEKGTKPRFTSGQGAKRTFGMTTWNSNGYFEEAKGNLMGAYTKTNPQYMILDEYWDNWVKTKGTKEIRVMSKDGSLKSKSIYSILRVREEGEVVQGDAAELYSNGEEEFAYDSDHTMRLLTLAIGTTRREMVGPCRGVMKSRMRRRIRRRMMIMMGRRRIWMMWIVAAMIIIIIIIIQGMLMTTMTMMMSTKMIAMMVSKKSKERQKQWAC
jgi:hypothetical protein